MKKHYLEIKQTFKTLGWRGTWKKYGFKLLFGVFVYYLIRDSILYLIIPYFIARHWLN